MEEQNKKVLEMLECTGIRQTTLDVYKSMNDSLELLSEHMGHKIKGQTSLVLKHMVEHFSSSLTEKELDELNNIFKSDIFQKYKEVSDLFADKTNDLRVFDVDGINFSINEISKM